MIRVRNVCGLLVTLAAATALLACSGPLRIEISEANPPTFVLHGGGSGYLGGVLVKEYDPDRPGKNIWVVGPKDGSIGLSHFRATKVRYGDLPDGWIQEIPSDGKGAPALTEGKTYQVVIEMFDVETRAAIFSIRDGKVVQRH